MQPSLENLKHKINKGLFPNDYPHFAGANLIVTDNPDYKGFEGDKVILTSHASAISWLIEELKTIHQEKINASNKYDFYPMIGELIEISVDYKDDLFETLNYIIEEIEKRWK